MNELESISAIYRGALVECTESEYYNGIRTAIQDQAGRWIDIGDGLRAMIALQEVKRLDNKFDQDTNPS